MDPVEPLATDARQLFGALRDHEGTDAHSAVAEPWLDRRTAAGAVVNADGSDDIDALDDDPLGSLLTAAERRELVRHRCLVRTPVNGDALAAEPERQREFFPFDWSLS